MKSTAPALGHFVPNLLQIYKSKVQFKRLAVLNCQPFHSLLNFANNLAPLYCKYVLLLLLFQREQSQYNHRVDC